jgi:hypothetical protein
MASNKWVWKAADRDGNPEWTPGQLWGSGFGNFLVRWQSVGIRLSPDAPAAPKATGPNWLRRADEALRKAFVRKPS